MTMDMPSTVLMFIVNHYHGKDTKDSSMYKILKVLNYFSKFLPPVFPEGLQVYGFLV